MKGDVLRPAVAEVYCETGKDEEEEVNRREIRLSFLFSTCFSLR